MKSLKFIFIIVFGSCCLTANGQTTYKDVKLDRDASDKTAFVIKNFNDYPVEVKFQFKVGSRDTEWIDFYGGNPITVDKHKTFSQSIGTKIYALKLTYVDILQPSFGEKAEQFIDNMAPLRDAVKDIKNP